MAVMQGAALLLLAAVAAGEDARAPDVYTVDFETNIGSDGGRFSVKVTRAWAPRGADRFLALVKSGFFNDAAFFRVVPSFVVQFGIAGTPSLNDKWSNTIPDDPVKESNRRGTITFATSGPNSRTSQIFINFNNNQGLDYQGFAPFGEVIVGMDVVDRVYNPTPGASGGVSQGDYKIKGNSWVRHKYPDINFITRATVRGDGMHQDAFEDTL